MRNRVLALSILMAIDEGPKQVVARSRSASHNNMTVRSMQVRPKKKEPTKEQCLDKINYDVHPERRKITSYSKIVDLDVVPCIHDFGEALMHPAQDHTIEGR